MARHGLKDLAGLGTQGGGSSPALPLARDARPGPAALCMAAVRACLSCREAVLGLGLAWLMIGMLLMPAGVSYNPGRLYQFTLAALLYLPALWFALRDRARLWRELWPLPAFRAFLLLLGWAALSLAWAQLRHPGDEFGRLCTVLLFVLGWHAWAGAAPHRAARLLAVVAWGMALCALAYSIVFLAQGHDEDDRIVGEGVVATANYAAAAMGAACMWLAQFPQRRWPRRAATWVAMAMLLLFVGLTQSRGVWLALAACALLAPLWWPGRTARMIAALVLLAVLAAVLWPLPILLERGASYRPEIFRQALHLIAAHPWLGLGQGTPFVIEAGGQQLTHSHNVLTQTAIELGLPGLALLLPLWALTAWSGWRHRAEPLGRVVLALWVYASVALQFDMPQLLDSPRPGWLLIWLPFALALGLEARDRARRAAPARVD